MYGGVLGAGAVAAPAALAFAGVGRTWMVVTVSLATAAIVVGVGLLRTSKISLFGVPEQDGAPRARG